MNRSRILQLLASALRKSRFACARTQKMVRDAIAAFLAAISLIDALGAA